MIGVEVGITAASVGEGEGSMTAEVGGGWVGVVVGDAATRITVEEVVGLCEGVGARDKRGWQPTNVVNTNRANRRSATTARLNSTLSALRYPVDSSAMTIRYLREVNWITVQNWVGDLWD